MSWTEIEWTGGIDPPWLEMRPVRIGEIPSALGTPDQYVLATVDGEPVLRVDAYASPMESYAFTDAVRWGDFIVVGWGRRVCLIDLHSHEVSIHLLDGYFGHLYASADYLLVTSAERCFRISGDGSLEWESELLGIDGVVVNHVKEDTIYGQGECDPPGGWQPFRIRLDSGLSV